MVISESLEKKSKNLAYRVADLSNCAQEPIAFCGAIQAGGLLLVIDSESMMIEAASRNWQTELGIASASALLGRSISEILDFRGFESFTRAQFIQNIESDNFFCTIKEQNKVYPVTFHQSGRNFLIELEFELARGAQYPVVQIKELVNALKSTDSIEAIAAKASAGIQKLSGYDRVMIYRFDEEWNGAVIGESKREDLVPFLYLKYPATDIPPQARALFFENKSRMIIDTKAGPEPITTRSLSLSELDLGPTLLRAVSPIHLQYLENMGVSASYAAPIRVNDKLWGLIACHHYSGARYPDREVRSAFELASQIVSGKISDLTARRRLLIKNETLELTQALLNDLAKGKDPLEAFEACSANLLDMTCSSGALIRMAGRQIVIGKSPTTETITAVFEKLRTLDVLSVWKSESLIKDLALNHHDPDAAGALAVPFSLAFEDALIWFRAEEVHEIKWGGKPMSKESGQLSNHDRLTPRGSFAEWVETVKHSSRPWIESDEECAQYLLFSFVQGIFSKAQMLSLAHKELERSARAKDEFISMVSHELRTPLGIIIGWIDILKENPNHDIEAVEAIEIIDRNAKTQVSLIDDLLDISRIISGKLRIDPQPGVNVVTIVSGLIESVKPAAVAKNISIEWSPPTAVTVTADSERLRQIIWNLINNAIKFTPKGGKVHISVGLKQNVAVIEVADNGIGIAPDQLGLIFATFMQEKISTSKSGGLGLGLSIVKALTELHGGTVAAASDGRGRGSRFVVQLPNYATKTAVENNVLPVSIAPMGGRTERLQLIRILIAEDHEDALRALQLGLERHGAIVKSAMNGDDALELLRREKFDLILSDIGMPDMDGYELMQLWREVERSRGVTPIPAVALTAFAGSKDRTKALASGFRSYIAKPVDRDELMAVIESFRIVPQK